MGLCSGSVFVVLCLCGATIRGVHLASVAVAGGPSGAHRHLLMELDHVPTSNSSEIKGESPQKHTP